MDTWSLLSTLRLLDVVVLLHPALGVWVWLLPRILPGYDWASGVDSRGDLAQWLQRLTVSAEWALFITTPRAGLVGRVLNTGAPKRAKVVEMIYSLGECSFLRQ